MERCTEHTHRCSVDQPVRKSSLSTKSYPIVQGRLITFAGYWLHQKIKRTLCKEQVDNKTMYCLPGAKIHEIIKIG